MPKKKTGHDLRSFSWTLFVITALGLIVAPWSLVRPPPLHSTVSQAVRDASVAIEERGLLAALFNLHNNTEP